MGFSFCKVFHFMALNSIYFFTCSWNIIPYLVKVSDIYTIRWISLGLAWCKDKKIKREFKFRPTYAGIRAEKCV